MTELATTLGGFVLAWTYDPKFPTDITDWSPFAGAISGAFLGVAVHVVYRFITVASETSQRFHQIATNVDETLVSSPAVIRDAELSLRTTMETLRRNTMNRSIADVMVNDSPFTGILGTLYAKSEGNEVINNIGRDDYLRHLGDTVTLADSSYLTIQYGGISWFEEYEWFFEYFYRKSTFNCTRILLVEDEAAIEAEEKNFEKIAKYWKLVGKNTQTYWITKQNLARLRMIAEQDGRREHSGHEIADLATTDIVVCDRKLCFQYNDESQRLDFWHNPTVTTFPYDWVFEQLNKEKEQLGDGDRKFIEVKPPSHQEDLRQLKFRESKSFRIDCAKIRNNYKQLVSIRPEAVVLAITKSDGYGLGTIKLAECLLQVGCKWFGVSTIEEALQLRTVSRTAHVLLMEGTNGLDVPLVVQYGFESLIWDLSTAKILNAEARRVGKVVDVHVKVNTGMNRLGVHPDEYLQLLKDLSTLKNIRVAGVASHLAQGHEPTSKKSEKQFALFKKITEVSRGHFPVDENIYFHIENSASFLSNDSPVGNMVRIGGLITGNAHPIPKTNHAIRRHHLFNECVSVVARVLQIQEIQPQQVENHRTVGSEISYDNRVFARAGGGRLAVVNIGYGDGVSVQWGGTAIRMR